MLFDLSNEYDVERFDNACKKLKAEGKFVELKKKDEKRSIPQNSYLHLIISFFAAEYGCTAEQAKVDFYKRWCNKDIYEVEVETPWYKKAKGDPEKMKLFNISERDVIQAQIDALMRIGDEIERERLLEWIESLLVKLSKLKRKTMKVLRSSSDLTKEEMATTITRFRNWSAMEAGIYLPSPDDAAYLKYCRQVIENNKDYL